MTKDSKAAHSKGTTSDKISGATRFSLFLILLLVAVYAWRPMGPGYDFWAHAAVGRWIWANGEVPRHTLFLWSVEPPYPWVAHSWLSELSFYGLQVTGNSLMGVSADAQDGALFVVAVMSLLTIAVFYLLWRLWQHRSPNNLVAPLFFAVAIWAAAPRFQPRPEVFTALAFTLLLLGLTEFHQARKEATDIPRSIWLLVPLFAIWANFHGAVMMGVLVFALAALGDAVQFRGDSRSRQLIIIAALCVGATLVTPFGFAYWRDVISSSASQMFTLIEEWQPPWQSEAMRPYVIVELLLAFVAFIAWLRNPNRRWSELAWLVVMSVLLLRQRRHLWLLAIVALVVAGNNSQFLSAQRVWNWWRKVSRQPLQPPAAPLRFLARAGTLFCIGFGVMVAALTKSDELVPLRGVSPKVPEAAMQFIEKNNLRGRMFNDYENSSYLQWRLNGAQTQGPNTGRVLASGRRPLYIDLLNAYEDGPRGLMVEYLDVLNKPDVARRVLNRRKVDYVILGSHRAKYPLARYLDRNSQEWQRVFHDDHATIWTRHNSQHN